MAFSRVPFSLLVPIGVYGGIFGYPILQFLAIRRMRAAWRAFAMLPLPAMVPVLFVTIQGLWQGSNLWPIVLILAAPVFGVYLILLLVLHASVQKNRVVKTGHHGGTSASRRCVPKP